ncbi:hypothetical protein L8O44_19245 [Enterobacter roggenkampii]|uniref:hypothetical protein n=1 Tax=Enterobacter TaxID=547 RepID=UPI0004DB49C1|nr:MULTISPECIES: hypothetical protein [Enterobacter]HDC4776906.1 hypothetical protein [Enterobacter kobei]KFA82654.1 hypothetical protein N037_14465 [Enterobacter sp. EGD-HP1]MCK7386429.1 hypothetical protein [Enterobacter cloacae]MCK7466055.1 hypothetical protein [Enterobacter roggenkampii]UDF98939.1 hypothetical protein LH408_12575 [Enterobacter cloacae]
MKVTQQRINEVAHIMNVEIYEEAFGGKARGRFLIDRKQMRDLLGTSKLHDTTLAKLYVACLDEGIVMIDLDEVFAFIEAKMVRKYRKAPVRITDKFVPPNESDDDLMEEEEED